MRRRFLRVSDRHILPFDFRDHLCFLIARLYYKRYRPWMARHHLRNIPPDKMVFRIFYAYYFHEVRRRER